MSQVVLKKTATLLNPEKCTGLLWRRRVATGQTAKEQKFEVTMPAEHLRDIDRANC